MSLETIVNGRLTWVNVENPTSEEIEYLQQSYSFHPIALEDCLSRVQRPKIDEYEDHLFVILQFPVYNKVTRVSMPSNVAIFVGASYLVTIHAGNLRPLLRIFKTCRENETFREEAMGRSSGYLFYQLVDRLVDYCFPMLDKIAGNIDAIEDQIFSDEAQGTVRELSIVRRDIIEFRRIFRPQIPVIASLELRQYPFLREDLDVYWGSISDHMNRIRDILEDHREVVEGLSDTNDSLTSYRINEVIRVLTLISTMMLPLAVITGIYGMNISVLPFANSQHSFIITIGVMVIVIGSMLALFKRRHWI